MRRRPILALLACAALAGPASATAQTPSTAAPATTGVPASTTAPATTGAPASAPAPGSTNAPASSSTPASTTTPASSGGRGGSSGDAAPWILLAVVGAILLLLAVLWGIARWWAWEPRWLLRARHATAEAGWRTSAAWAEFRDWVRLGR